LQSDIACLQAADLDYEHRCFVYDRLKTGNMGGMRRRFSSLPRRRPDKRGAQSIASDFPWQPAQQREKRPEIGNGWP